jgi:hypothetical protein
MKYFDHDVIDRDKFSKFVPQFYMDRKETSPLGVPILEPKQWITRLYNKGIMNLLEIPHFRSGKDVNSCVKQLLVLVHGGIL